MPSFLVFDIGTSGGRAVVGSLTQEQISLNWIHKFSNRAVPVSGTLYWDILYLWSEVITGVRRWFTYDGDDLQLDGIGLDTWAVDFALLDEQGKLLENPVHNRDTRTDGMIECVLEIVSRDEIYARTGIQFMQINTLYQLFAMVQSKSATLRNAATFLTIADLLNYWLTGKKVVEFTSATCTQFYDPRAGAWTIDILERLGIPTQIFPPVVPPGTVLGPVDSAPELAVAGTTPVIAVATHDTASAVAAVPAESRGFAYISSGTWSLMGAEVPAPVISPASLKYNFTNEGGVNGTFRLLKNILGMWLVQACQQTWNDAQESFGYDEMTKLAGAAPPFGALIDPEPNSPYFRTPGDMPARIAAFAARTGQLEPNGKGEVLRCIFESLALKYRQTLGQLEEVLGHTIEVIHIVGGGSRNALLCQMTADATNRLVIAGPDEATAIGNVIVQAIATGHLKSLDEGRRMVIRSTDLKQYWPAPSSDWDDAYRRFLDITRI